MARIRVNAVESLDAKPYQSGDRFLAYRAGAPKDEDVFWSGLPSDSPYFVLVSSIDDLPDPVAGVITLAANTTYYFTTTIDLAGSRLVGGANTVILGPSSENARIVSTGLTGTAMISSEYSMPIRHITLEADVIFNLDATGNSNQALDWYGVNLVSDSIGTIKNYSNFVVSSMAFLGASGLVFDGTFGTIALSDTLFLGSTGTIITIPSTATIGRRLRISYSSMIVGAGQTGIDVSTSASIPVEGYIFDTLNFSGSGTYTAGVTYDDNKARWGECRGVVNSASLTGYYMHNNAAATTISAINTPVKAAGTTTEVATSQRFTVTDNRAQYVGSIMRDFKITASVSLTSGNNNAIGVYIAKNGTEINESETYVTTSSAGRIENCICQVITTLADTDYIELFVENATATNNITVTDINLIVEALN